MKILFITPRFPYPPIKGDKLRNYYFIKELSRENDVSLLSFIEEDNDREYMEEMEKYCKHVEVVKLPPWNSVTKMIANVSSHLPFQVAYYKSSIMRSKFGEMAKQEEFDIVHVSLIRMGYYLDTIKAIPVILDHIDALSLNMSRRYNNERNWLLQTLFKVEYLRTQSYEISFKNIPSIITSKKDKDALRNNGKVEVLSNGVDSSFYFPSSNNKIKDIDLVFVGNMGYFPNVNAMQFFMKEVWVNITNMLPQTNLYITGSNPDKSVQAMEEDRKVIVTGFVDDVRDYYYRAKVFIAPLQSGTGIQNKVLEAMACGVPVVSTKYGNSGIQATNGKEIVIADTPIEFAESVVSMLKSTNDRKRIAEGARRLVVERFSWKTKVDELVSFYKKVING